MYIIYIYIIYTHSYTMKERPSHPDHPHHQRYYTHNNVGLLETSKTVCLAQALKPMHSLIQGGVTNQLEAYPKKLLMLCLMKRWLNTFPDFTKLCLTNQRLKRNTLTIFENTLMAIPAMD